MNNVSKRWRVACQPIHFFLLTAAACLTLGACNSVQPTDETAKLAQHSTKQPNIIFILNDDLGWGDVGYHGSPIKTPTLDGLAQRGVELNRYYTYAICSPTRAAFLSGRSSLETGVDAPIASSEVLPLDITLLPQHLKQLGYQTAMVGKWHLGRTSTESLPFKRGFDYYYGFLGGFIDHYTHLSSQGNLDWQRNGVSVREEGYTTDLMTDDAIKQIKGRNKSKPLFLYLAYDAPHNPLQAPEAAIQRYAHMEDPVKRNYAAMVDYFDSQLARVLATVEAEGIAKDTLIIWASDNGPQGNSGGNAGELRGNKGTAFEGGQRVPAIAYWPGHLEGGKRLDSVVTVLDWFPTLIQAAGGTVPKDKLIVGHNVMAVLQGAKQSPDPSMVIGNFSRANMHFESAYQWPLKLVRGATSLINPQQTPAPAADAKTVLLFDVVADPTESKDLSSQQPAMVTKLLANLNAAPRAPRSLSEWAEGEDEAGGEGAAAGMAAGMAAGGGMAAGMGAGGATPVVLLGTSTEKGQPYAEAAAAASKK